MLLRSIRLMTSFKVGIIGGSGLSDPSVLGVTDCEEVVVDTPFGSPSAAILTGRIDGVSVAVLSRHGRGHTIMPSAVNYRANLWALHHLGCCCILSSTASGSLQEDIPPGTLILLDQFIDRTTRRPLTFYNGSCAEMTGICHLPMAEPFCQKMRNIVLKCAENIGVQIRPTGTTVCIEGPRFSTKAESLLYRSWNSQLVNMTSVPEATLAGELGLSYASVAMATDYDCWRVDEPSVGVTEVMKTFRDNVDRVVKLLREAVGQLSCHDWTEELLRRRTVVADNTMLPRQQ